MLSSRILGVLLLLAAVVLPGPALALDLQPGQTYTFAGVIATISRADAKLVLTSTATKVPKSVDLKVDDRTQVTVNKKLATVADLEAGDRIWAKFAAGVAMKLAITRDPAQAPADRWRIASGPRHSRC